MKIRVFMTGLMLIAKNEEGPLKGHWAAGLVDTTNDRTPMKHSARLYFGYDDGIDLEGDYAIGGPGAPFDDLPLLFHSSSNHGQQTSGRTQARDWHWVLPVASYLGGTNPKDLSSEHHDVVASFRLNGDRLETARLATDRAGQINRFGPPIDRVAAETVMLQTDVADNQAFVLRRNREEWAQVRQLETEEIGGEQIVNLLLANSLPPVREDRRIAATHWHMLERLLVEPSRANVVPTTEHSVNRFQPPGRMPEWMREPENTVEGTEDRPLCMPGG